MSTIAFRLLALALIASTAAATVTGCVVKYPHSVVTSPALTELREGEPRTTREGRACALFVFHLPFFAVGDMSTNTAMGAIMRGERRALALATVDEEVTNYILAHRRCTVVRGHFVPPPETGAALDPGRAGDSNAPLAQASEP